MKNYDLNMTVDEHSWLREHAVYCPIPWCHAHKLRHVRCGDADGDYEGIHVGRIRAVNRDAKQAAREINALVEMGCEDPGLSLGILRMMQDAIDQGTLKGRRGRRKLYPI